MWRSVSFPLKPRGLILLSRATKVSKNALSAHRPKELKITVRAWEWLFFSTLSAHSFRRNKSLLIGNFQISALCLSSAFFRTSLFKTGAHEGYRYSFLFIRSLPCVFFFGVLIHSLLAPGVAMRCFSWLSRVGLMLLTISVSLCKKGVGRLH